MTDNPPESAPPAGEVDSPKPRFKTNTANQLFRPTPPPVETPAAAPAAAPVRQTVTKLTLPNKKPSEEPQDRPAEQSTDQAGAQAGSEASVQPETGAQPGTSAGESVKSGTEQPEPATDASAESTTKPASEPENAPSAASSHPKHEYTEEELSNKGISVAGRFHSASNINWEDEEEDWVPQAAPSFGASSVVASALKGGRKSPMRADPASVAKLHEESPKPRASESQRLTINTSKSSPQPHSSSTGEGLTIAPAPAETETAWGARKTVQPSSSLADKIREARTAEPAAPRSRLPAAGARGDPSGLDRFKIRPGGPMGMGMGVRRGPPPLNPRRALEEEDDEETTFQMGGDFPPSRGRGFDFDGLDFSRRLPPSDGSASFSRPQHSHRPIPARLLRSEPDAAAPSAPSPPSAPVNPFGAARPAPDAGPSAGSWQAQKAAVSPPEDIKEVQEKEMGSAIEQLRARVEEERKAEAEKKERLEAKLAQMREEKRKKDEEEKKLEQQRQEEKRAAKEAKLKEREAKLKAERERREKEQAERANREREEREKVLREKEREREERRRAAAQRDGEALRAARESTWLARDVRKLPAEPAAKKPAAEPPIAVKLPEQSVQTKFSGAINVSGLQRLAGPSCGTLQYVPASPGGVKLPANPRSGGFDLGDLEILSP